MAGWFARLFWPPSRAKYLEAKRKEKQRPKLEPIGMIEPVCPYCASQLEKMPGRKKKCPQCTKPIFVRTRPTDRQRILVREDQLEVIEEQWAIVNGTHQEFLANKSRAEQIRVQLRDKFGREPSNNDIQWSLLNQDAMKHASRKDWGLYRNVRLNMAQLLAKEGKDKEALRYYLWVCYIDLNGPSNMGGIKDPKILKEYPPFSPKKGDLVPGIVGEVEDLANKLEMANQQLVGMFKKVADSEYKSLRLPVAPKTACAKIEKSINLNVKSKPETKK